MHVPEAGPESRSTTRPRPGAFPPVAGMAAGRRCAGDTRSVRPARSRSLLAVRQPGLRRTGVRSWVVVRAEGAERSMGAARIVLGGKGRNPATSEELARCNNRRPFIWKKKKAPENRNRSYPSGIQTQCRRKGRKQCRATERGGGTTAASTFEDQNETSTHLLGIIALLLRLLSILALGRRIALLTSIGATAVLLVLRRRTTVVAGHGAALCLAGKRVSLE